jgi:hypothetical protein
MVEEFCAWMTHNFPYLDIIINNACQTIRRPPAYYAHLMDAEHQFALPSNLRDNLVNLPFIHLL